MPSGGSVSSPTSPYGARTAAAPLPEPPFPGRGRGRPTDRRWEPNDIGRGPRFAGPEGPNAPRDLPDRPPARFSGPDRRDDRPPAPISGTNNIPIGGRSSGYGSDTSASNAVRSPVDRYRPADDLGGLPRRPPPVEADSYDRRGPALPPPDLPPPGPPRTDRAGRRPSVGQDGLSRGRGADPVPDRPLSTLPPRPRDLPPRDGAPSRQSRVPPGPPAGPPPTTEPRIWQTRDEAQSARPPDVRPNDSRAPRDDTRPPPNWTRYPDTDQPRRWSVNDPYPAGPGGPDAPGPRTRSPEVPLRNRPSSPPPAGDGRRYDTPLVEHPVAGKVHPERARLLGGETPVPPEDPGRSSRPAGNRRPGRSPDRSFSDRPRPNDIDRSLPPRPADDVRMPPPRDRSPPPSQNGHRPGMKRGSSLLERLNLDDIPRAHDGGSSLRDRVELPPHGSSEGTPGAQAEAMEVDAEGNGDDAQKAGGGGRGTGRKRNGKPRRPRRNGGA
ncbi:hypothetical protein OH77DRAFT_1392502 [Trametes cingulata]|nr:hypothetical protein OH77DRAFT_1392502 [Trametes cingulata]